MRKFAAAAIASTLTTAAFAVSTMVAAPSAHAKDATGSGVVAGKMLYTADKHQLGAIYGVTADGSAQVIVDGRMVTVPAASVAAKDGKFWTSLTRKEALGGH